MSNIPWFIIRLPIIFIFITMLGDGVDVLVKVGAFFLVWVLGLLEGSDMRSRS